MGVKDKLRGRSGAKSSSPGKVCEDFKILKEEITEMFLEVVTNLSFFF